MTIATQAKIPKSKQKTENKLISYYGEIDNIKYTEYRQRNWTGYSEELGWISKKSCSSSDFHDYKQYYLMNWITV